MISESSQTDVPVYTVVVSEKGGAERRVVFRSTELRVGRVQGNDIVLPKGNVSKRHARLLYREGRFIVTDLNSTNGTFVNRRRIAQATIVRDGDRVYIGDFVLRVELGDRATNPEEGELVPTTAEVHPLPPGAVDWERTSTLDIRRSSSSGPPARFSDPPPERTSHHSHVADDIAEPHRATVHALLQRVRAEVPPQQAVDSSKATRIKELLQSGVRELEGSGGIPDSTSASAVAEQAFAELTGLGPLQELVDDPEVTAISITDFTEIVAIRSGRTQRIPPGFSSLETLDLAIRRLIEQTNRPLTSSEVVVERDLGGGWHLSAVLGAAAPTGPLLTLRRPRTVAASLEDLVRRGTISRAVATFFRQCVAARLNILVVGPEDQGSAEVVSALAGATSQDRVICVDEREHFALPRRPARLTASSDSVDALLHFLTGVAGARVVIALDRPESTAAIVEAAGGGLDGVVARLTASSLRRALVRLPGDVIRVRSGLSAGAAAAWVRGSFDLVVEVARLRDGRARVLRVSEITADPSSGLSAHDVFRFTADRVAGGGSVEGSFAATGYVPECLGQMQAVGAAVESSLFSRPPSR